MNEIRSIEELSQAAQEAYPGAEPAMAMVAEVKPAVLEAAVEGVYEEKFDRALRLESAKTTYEAESGSTVTTESLRMAAIDLTRAEEETQSHRGKVVLASTVRNLQRRLSWPMRATATALATLALGVGSAAYAVEAKPETYRDITTKKARSFEEIYAKSPVTVGIIGGLIGVAVGSAVGNAFSGREAHRRARRIVTTPPKRYQRLA